MASLITYKFYAATPRDKKNTGMGYLPAFTVVNIVFLALLLALWAILR